MKKLNRTVERNISYPTIPSRIAEVLREAILNGEFQGGEQLKQEELASQFNASLSPVREALKSLEAEGLVRFYPNRGAVVAELSAEEVREIFDIRYFLEAGALEFAIPKLAESDINTAEAILDEADQESLGRRWDGLNWQFHRTIYQVGERPRLLSLIQTMHNNVRRYMRLYLITLHYQAKAQKEHRDLLFACKHGDVGAAKNILRLHTKEAAELLVAYLEKT